MRITLGAAIRKQKILPGTGRWHAAGVAEGSRLSFGVVFGVKWDPSVSRFASATSPCRGGFK